MRSILYFSHFEVQNSGFLRVFLIKLILQSSSTIVLRSFRYFCKELQNAAPATTLDTVTRLLSPATAIRQNSIFATRQYTPATRSDNAPTESAAPATRKGHDNVDTPLKYCACHSKCKRHLDACLKTQHKQPICDEIYNADIVKSWIWNVPQMVRPSHITANMLRTVADGCDRKIYAEGTPIQPFAVHSGTIERTETSKLNSSSVQC